MATQHGFDTQSISRIIDRLDTTVLHLQNAVEKLSDTVDGLNDKLIAANVEITKLRSELDHFKGDITPADHIIHHRALKLNESLTHYAKRALIERIASIAMGLLMVGAMFTTYTSVKEMMTANQSILSDTVKEIKSLKPPVK